MRQHIKRIAEPFLSFFQQEAGSGILLLLCAVLAIFLANSPWADDYEHLLHTPLAVGFGSWSLELGLLHWINDGLMAVFFFVIGLEIKREFLYGELRTRSSMLLPVGAAMGGMILPALFYLALNYGQETMAGWGIPMATDIAFALGIMTLAARQAPLGLVIFLTALAIVDDLGAIVVIALCYSGEVSAPALLIGILFLLLALGMNRLRSSFLPGYLLCGALAWLSFFHAGIHPTIAGVLLGFAIPAEAEPEHSLLHRLEHALEPWSAYAIMPVFALANAGVPVSFSQFDFSSPIFLGILAGLCLGKPLGIAGVVWLLHRSAGVSVPGNAASGQLAATGMLGGIGFTMSIFIASLAFPDPEWLAIAKWSILAASVLSGLAGAMVFQWISYRTTQSE